METHDVVIVGGGAMGRATAYHLLRRDPGLAVAVVEPDPTHEHCSTLRSDGNVRVQFNLVENVEMSLYAFEVLETFADDMAVDGWRPDPAPKQQGNLFLTDEDGRTATEEGIALQRSLGCDVMWMDTEEIAARWPAYRAEGVVGGAFGPRDGAVDPTAVLEGFRRAAVHLGAASITGEVTNIHVEDGRTAGVELADGRRLAADHVVVAAGGWSTPIAATAGVEIPVEPVMRTVHVVETPVDLEGLPSVFLPDGLYLLPESPSTAQVAWSTDDDPVGFDFTYHRQPFHDVVWPALVATLPEFDALRIASGWCGIYATNTLDHNAILGEWPEVPGLWLATGFSGHGFQHTPAMGRHLAELLLGHPTSLDLSRLGPRRVLDGRPLREHAGRII